MVSILCARDRSAGQDAQDGKEKRKQNCSACHREATLLHTADRLRGKVQFSKCDGYRDFRMRTYAATPARPLPNSSSVPGSGTATGSVVSATICAKV